MVNFYPMTAYAFDPDVKLVLLDTSSTDSVLLVIGSYSKQLESGKQVWRNTHSVLVVIASIHQMCWLLRCHALGLTCDVSDGASLHHVATIFHCNFVFVFVLQQNFCFVFVLEQVANEEVVVDTTAIRSDFNYPFDSFTRAIPIKVRTDPCYAVTLSHLRSPPLPLCACGQRTRRLQIHSK